MSGPGAQSAAVGQQSYRTPKEFLERVKRRFMITGFDWDLACSVGNCVAGEGNGFEFDRGVDALKQDWTELADPDITCYLNPPFAQSGAFAAKCAGSGARILALVPVAIGTQWWKRSVHNIAHVVGVGRLMFDLPDGSGPVVGKDGRPQPINRDCALLAYNILPNTTSYYLLENWKAW